MKQQLEGFSYNLDVEIGQKIRSHTYVKATGRTDSNKFYDCYGHHVGGMPVRGSKGSASNAWDRADNYRGKPVWLRSPHHPFEKKKKREDHAGIGKFYGTVGVCHQAANRFLYSVSHDKKRSVIVTNIKIGVLGSIHSVALWGHYGRGHGSRARFFLQIYPAANVLYPEGRDLHSVESLETQLEVASKSSDLDHLDELGLLQGNYMNMIRNGKSPDPDEMVIKEFNLLVKHTIGSFGIDPIVDGITDIQKLMFKSNDEIGNGNLKGADFANAHNDATHGLYQQLAKRIGKDHYKLLFGTDYDDYVVLVDPDIAEVTRQ